MYPVSKLFSCTQSIELSQKIVSDFGKELGKVFIYKYSDGEFQPSFEETLRGTRTFLIGSTHPTSDNLMELLLMIDAAKRASAKHINVVVPYFGWARQDRKDKSRVPIGAKLIAKLLETAGATRIITMDLHADQIQGFFEVPVDHLFSSSVFLPHIIKNKPENLTIASPDMGGSKRALAYSKYLGCELVICFKQRKNPSEIEKMDLIGNVKGRNVILVDDMIDTAGTLIKAGHLIKEKGAKSIKAIASHGLFSGEAYNRIEESQFDEVWVTDSIPTRRASSKIKIISCSELFAKVMSSVSENRSISSNFLM